jgi:hypothetical protein
MLVGCSGGGGGLFGGEMSLPDKPSADAGPSLAVNDGTDVTIAGSGFGWGADISSYSWAQTSGPGVILYGSDSADLSFVAPTVTVAELLTFQLTVTDDQGQIGTDSVSVRVEPQGLLVNSTFPDPALARCVSASWFWLPEGSSADQLADLTCHSPGISDATGIEAMTSLATLTFIGGWFDSIDLSANTALTVLDLGFNELTSIDLSANAALEELYLSGNELTSIDVSANSRLERIELASNQLVSIDLTANAALTRLTLSSNQLNSVDLSANTDLTYVDLSFNELTSIDVSANTALDLLDLNGNEMLSIDVSANSALTTLDLSNNANIPCPDIQAIEDQFPDLRLFRHSVDDCGG